MRRLNLSRLAVMSLVAMTYCARAQGFEGMASIATASCTISEKWQWSDRITPRWREAFESTITKTSGVVPGFAQALAYRQSSIANPEAKMLAEYWISRSMMSAKFVHLAQTGFNLIASQSVDAKTAGIQIAAVDCLNRIHDHFPTFKLEPSVSERIEALRNHASTPDQKLALDQAIANRIADQLADGSTSPTLIIHELSLLNSGSPYESFAHLLWEAHRGDHQATVTWASRFLEKTDVPKPLLRQKDRAIILLARAYYSLGKPQDAIAQYQRIETTSAEFSKVLSEHAWASLMAENYSHAIGSAISLQEGRLRHTFEPEAPMILAMAFNELCQFPESLRAVRQFKQLYEKPYRWLDAWSKHEAQSPENLYALAVQLIKGSTEVPDRVASEWLRSPVFLASQLEINTLLDRKDLNATVLKSAVQQMNHLATLINNRWRVTQAKIHEERRHMAPGASLPMSLRDAVAEIKRNILLYKRIRASAPYWKAMVASFDSRAPQLQNSLVHAINSDLRHRTRQMLSELQEIADNNQLIEVEIYNDASQDIIWQNANPDYKEIAQKMNDEARRANSEQNWDWGRAPAGLIDGTADHAEIWEDEIGSFKADMIDNCSSKDKYLAIKRRGP